MEPGETPVMEPDDEDENLEFLVGQIDCCFHPSGYVEVPFIMGLLSLAKQDGYDPRGVYETAVEQLPPGRKKFGQDLPYERVKPQA